MNERQFVIRVPERSLNNLKVFLSRSSLTGAEVPEYTTLLNFIYNAEEDMGIEDEKVEENDKEGGS